MAVIILLMIIGLIAAFPEYRLLNKMHYLHLVIVIVLSGLLLIYPIKPTFLIRLFIILIGIIFFYLMFYLYPETRFSFTLICFIPAVAILFFDRKLFYISFFSNLLLFFIGYMFLLHYITDESYDFLTINVVGNITNFLGSQAIIYFIFRMFIERIKEQQIYYEQLQQSERQRMTGQLAAAVAHEIRNPLTVVKGFLQLYEQDEQIKAEPKDHIKLMIDELNVAEHVITQFLMVSKPDKNLEIIEIDMEQALRSVVDLVRSYGLLRDNGISLSVQENGLIKINMIEFNQLMINIIKNAMEASDQGEEVYIETSINDKNNTVEINVRDNGCGMAKEEIELLEPMELK